VTSQTFPLSPPNHRRPTVFDIRIFPRPRISRYLWKYFLRLDDLLGSVPSSKSTYFFPDPSFSPARPFRGPLGAFQKGVFHRASRHEELVFTILLSHSPPPPQNHRPLGPRQTVGGIALLHRQSLPAPRSFSRGCFEIKYLSSSSSFVPLISLSSFFRWDFVSVGSPFFSKAYGDLLLLFFFPKVRVRGLFFFRLLFPFS